MPDSPAIEVEALRKTYRDGLFRPRRIEALRGVSFSVERGTIFGLMGLPAGDRRGRRSVGYLPENHRIPRHHTANTALEYYGALSGMRGRDIRKRRPELLELVGLSAWGGSSVKKFSKGMLQRLGLAQALMHDP